MHSVLITGCGSIGERHLRCFQRTGRARVTACDTNNDLLQSMAESYQVPTCSDWGQAITDGDFEIVVICTPAHLHVPMARRALESGRHVLIEKPLSVDLDGVDDLIQLQTRSGRQAAVAYVYNSFPFLSEARQFLRNESLGTIRHVVAHSGQHFPAFRPAYARTYFGDHRTGGGAIQDGLTHIANWIESVIGPTDSVFCDCAHQVLADVTVEDTVNVCARHGDILVSYAFNQFQAPNEATLQFNAIGGSVKIELHRQRWGFLRLGDSEWTWSEPGQLDRDANFIAQANSLLDQTEGSPSRLCSLEAAKQTLHFNLAALASAKSGVPVKCAKAETLSCGSQATVEPPIGISE